MTDTAPPTEAELAGIRAELSDPERRIHAMANGHVHARWLLAEVDRLRAERDRLLAFIERGFDTHMQFGVINPDGTTEMQPCADWCRACKLQRAEADAERLRNILDGDDLPLLCADCPCADCDGGFDHHLRGLACTCGCKPACDLFVRDPRLDQITAAIEPILGSPLAEAIAHAAWHAIHPAVGLTT